MLIKSKFWLQARPFFKNVPSPLSLCSLLLHIWRQMCMKFNIFWFLNKSFDTLCSYNFIWEPYGCLSPIFSTKLTMMNVLDAFLPHFILFFGWLETYLGSKMLYFLTLRKPFAKSTMLMTKSFKFYVWFGLFYHVVNSNWLQALNCLNNSCSKLATFFPMSSTNFV